MVSKKSSHKVMQNRGMDKDEIKIQVSNVNGSAFALQFVGSLFYLYLVYLIGSNTMTVSTLLTTGDSTFWLGILPAIAVISGIALFFHSFTYLFGNPMKTSALKLATVAGFAFFALTIGVSGYYFVAALIGFILTEIAAYMAKSCK